MKIFLKAWHFSFYITHTIKSKTDESTIRFICIDIYITHSIFTTILKIHFILIFFIKKKHQNF